MKHFYIAMLFFVTALSLCSEQKNKKKPYTTLAIKARSIICFDKYAVIHEYEKEPKYIHKKEPCYIYDLLEQKKIKEIDNENIIYEIIKHPHKPIAAILEYLPGRTHMSNLMKIYNVPQGEKISSLSQLYSSLYSPIFIPYNTTIIGVTGLYSDVIHNYTTHTTNQFTHKKKISVNQWLKKACNQNFPDESTKELTYGLFNGIHNFNGSYIAFNNHMSRNWLSVYDTFNESIILNQENKEETIISVAFHPFIPHILAILSKKHKPYDVNHIVVHLFNIKTNRLFTILTKICKKQEVNLEHTQRNIHLIDFFCNGTKLIVALFKKCIILHAPEMYLNNFYPLGTKDKCIFAQLILQNYFDNQKNLLPHDIKWLLIHHLLKLSEIQCTNFHMLNKSAIDNS